MVGQLKRGVAVSQVRGGSAGGRSAEKKMEQILGEGRRQRAGERMRGYWLVVPEETADGRENGSATTACVFRDWCRERVWRLYSTTRPMPCAYIQLEGGTLTIRVELGLVLKCGISKAEFWP